MKILTYSGAVYLVEKLKGLVQQLSNAVEQKPNVVVLGAEEGTDSIPPNTIILRRE